MGKRKGGKKMRQSYPSDITREQFALIQHSLATVKKETRPREIDLYDIFCAVLYRLREGCRWRSLPHDFPKWSTVKSFYYRAVASGTWEQVMQDIVQETRRRAGRAENPSYGIIDSQSVKTVYASDERGIDGGKKRKGENGTS